MQIGLLPESCNILFINNIITHASNFITCQERPLRAPRANRGFGTDEKRIRTKSTVLDKGKSGLVSIQDRRLRADVLFIRAQSTIRADGSPSAQVRSLQLDVWS